MRAAEIFKKISGMAFCAHRTAGLRLALTALLLAASPAAFAAAGQVIFVTGQAFVQRDQQIPATRGLAVEQGDTVVTYQDGRVQLLMANGDRIAIRPNSRFRIDEFVAPTADQGREGLSVRQLGKSFYSLLRGGFRTLTGTRGQRSASTYRVRTPVATLGIRGTYYVARYCNNDCYSGQSRAGKSQRRSELKGIPAYAALWFSDLAPRDISAPLQLAQAGDEFAQTGELLPNGLDLGVIHGAVELINDGGTTVVGAGEFTSIKSPEQKGQVTNTPPQSLQQDMQDAELGGDWTGEDETGGDDGEDDDPHSGRRSPGEEGEGDTDDGEGAGAESGAGLSNEGDLTNEPEQSVIVTDADGNTVDLGGGDVGGGAPDGGGGTAGGGGTGGVGGTGGTAGTGGTGGTAGTGGTGGAGGAGGTPGVQGSSGFSLGDRTNAGSPANLVIDGTGDLREFDADGGSQNYTYNGTGPSLDRGQDIDGGTGLNWGRWSGGSATENSVDCPAGCNIDLTSQSLHWIYSTNAPVLPVGGTYNYQLIGNTNPTDQNGNIGTLNSATFRADFLNQTVDSSVNLSVGGQNWDASGTGNFSQTQPGSFGGDYSSVSSTNCSSGCTATGSFDGFFTGGDGNGAPPGAGMTYELGNTNGDQVDGAAAFGNPAPEVAQ